MTINMKTKVLPGHRIEVANPDLAVGEDVHVTIQSPNLAEQPVTQTFLEWLRSLPPSRRTPEEWAQFDREFRAERDSWD